MSSQAPITSDTSINPHKSKANENSDPGSKADPSTKMNKVECVQLFSPAAAEDSILNVTLSQSPDINLEENPLKTEGLVLSPSSSVGHCMSVTIGADCQNALSTYTNISPHPIASETTETGFGKAPCVETTTCDTMTVSTSLKKSSNMQEDSVLSSPDNNVLPSLDEISIQTPKKVFDTKRRSILYWTPDKVLNTALDEFRNKTPRKLASQTGFKLSLQQTSDIMTCDNFKFSHAHVTVYPPSRIIPGQALYEALGNACGETVTSQWVSFTGRTAEGTAGRNAIWNSGTTLGTSLDKFMDRGVDSTMRTFPVGTKRPRRSKAPHVTCNTLSSSLLLLLAILLWLTLNKRI